METCIQMHIENTAVIQLLGEVLKSCTFVYQLQYCKSFENFRTNNLQKKACSSCLGLQHEDQAQGQCA